MFTARLAAVLVACGIALCVDVRVSASIVVDQRDFDSTSIKIPGQSITIPTGKYTNLSFNWYASDGSSAAFGELFVLDQEYLGNPEELSPTTQGFLAKLTPMESVSPETDLVVLFADVVNGILVDVRNPARLYFYSNTAPDTPLGLSRQDVYPGGIAYEEPPQEFIPLPSFDWAFRFQADVVPEPSSLVVWSLGVVGGVVGLRRRRRKQA